MKVVSELGDNNTISPEGVVAFDGHVAVANYDGNNVQIFSYTGTKLCEIPVFHAHGIAHTDGYLFATSLGDRQVLKIDTDECAIVSRTGSQGWARGQFMWPTGLGAGNGKLVVSDAHTGMLSSLSADTFEIYEHWGGNGPGAFNMPYAAEFDNEDVWIISTFNRTIFQMRDRKVINAWAQEMEDNVKSSLQWKLDSAKYSADYVRNENCRNTRNVL